MRLSFDPLREDWARLKRSRITAVLALVAVALSGAVLGLLVGGSVNQPIGPVDATMKFSPAVFGDTQIDVPPLGNLGADTHDGPLKLDVGVVQVREADARRIVENPFLIESLGDQVTRDVSEGMRRLAIKSALAGMLGTVVLTAVVYRRVRPVLAAVAMTTVALGATAAYGRASFREDALATPTYNGLLSLAPAAIGDVEDLRNNFTAYGQQLSKIVTNVSQLYDVTSSLPQAPDDDTIRVLFVADIHDNTTTFDVMESVIEQFGIVAVVDAGDISDHGLAVENPLFEPIRGLGVPYVYVRGNHDSALTEQALRAMPNVTVLNDNVATIAGLRIAGSGDPLFTPDQTVKLSAEEQDTLLREQGDRLANAVGATTDQPAGADLVVVHEPKAAEPLFGRVPLVLSGHTHERAADTRAGTHLLIQGSSGGAGLRALEHEDPTPLQLSVLYFDPDTKQLVAYDDLTLGGLGQTSVQIQRHAVDTKTLEIPGAPLAPTVPAPPVPTPTATSTTTSTTSVTTTTATAPAPAAVGAAPATLTRRYAGIPLSH